MIVVRSETLTALIQDIASRARDLVDQNGRPVIVPTFNDRQLRAAALVALQVATGDAVWPEDQRIDLPESRRLGVLNIRE